MDMHGLANFESAVASGDEYIFAARLAAHNDGVIHNEFFFDPVERLPEGFVVGGAHVRRRAQGVDSLHAQIRGAPFGEKLELRGEDLDFVVATVLVVAQRKRQDDGEQNQEKRERVMRLRVLQVGLLNLSVCASIWAGTS